MHIAVVWSAGDDESNPDACDGAAAMIPWASNAAANGALEVPDAQ